MNLKSVLNYLNPSVSFIDIYSRLSTHSVVSKQSNFNVTQRTKLARKFLSKDIALPKSFVVKEKKVNMLSTSLMKSLKDEKVHPRLYGLNKIFMEKITSIICTSDIASQIAGMALDITQVRVQQGLCAIHIYWTCSDPNNDERLHEILVNAASFIRFELYFQKVLGRIPPLIFIRDESHRNSMEVEKRLLEADFGKDFEPNHPLLCPKYIPVIQKELSQDIWESLDSQREEEKREQESLVEYPSEILTLQHNICHVNREQIMAMVKKGVKASQGQHRDTPGPFAPSLSSNANESVKGNSFSPPCSFSRTSEIRKWVSQYKRLRKKAKRESNKQNQTMSCEYLDEEDNYSEHPYDYSEMENYVDETDWDGRNLH